MINKDSLSAVESSTFSSCFLKPLYSSFCFSRIPATLSYLLTGDKKDKALPSSCFQEELFDGVIFLFLDAFGWHSFAQHLSSDPLLQRFAKQGIISKITSQFPSTTTAHVTTIHTGLEVGQSGLYEWFQYEPLVDAMIAPLLFSYAGDSIASSLLASPHPITSFFPFTTLYDEFQKKGITSHLFQEAGICSSPYSQSIAQGAHLHGYFTIKQGLQTLSESFTSSSKEKTYSFFYYPHIDSTGHRMGPSSPSFTKTILHCLHTIEQELLPAFMSSPKKLALLISADHGMVDVKPKNTLYINSVIKDFTSYIQVSKKDRLLSPAGSCRDFFLHIKEELKEQAITLLRAELSGKAEVYPVEELIEKKIFGENLPSSRFLDRVGNVVILPYEGESIWWFEPHKFQQNFFGAHGGLTRKEVEIPFLFLSNHAN